MEAGLSAETFTSLLKRLDTDREQAGEKYEDLRRALIKLFEWRGALYPDELADEVFNRIARKVNEGVEIKDLVAYSHEVARLIFLETTKRADRNSVSVDVLQSELAAVDRTTELLEKEQRLACLEHCLQTLPRENAELILEYYSYQDRKQVQRRRALAERLGLRRETLANRAQRFREKLERCVDGCLQKKPAI